MNFFRGRTPQPKRPGTSTWSNPKTVIGTSLICSGPTPNGLYSFTGISGNTEAIAPTVRAIVSDLHATKKEVPLETVEALKDAGNFESLSIIKPTIPNLF